MDKLKEWLGWIVFCGVIPTVAFLIFARYMKHNEAAFYLIGVPSLLIYFYILGVFRLNIPGAIREANSDDVVYRILGEDITGKQPSLKVFTWLRGVVILLLMPVLGVTFILYGVRDGEIRGYFLGPAMFWVSGGYWALVVRFLRERKGIAQ